MLDRFFLWLRYDTVVLLTTAYSIGNYSNKTNIWCSVAIVGRIGHSACFKSRASWRDLEPDSPNGDRDGEKVNQQEVIGRHEKKAMSVPEKEKRE
jgi:hypothetical protein